MTSRTRPPEFLPGELVTIQAAYTGEGRAERRFAMDLIIRWQQLGGFGPTAQRLLGILAGPAHKARRKWFGRRLAFSFAFLIVTRPKAPPNREDRPCPATGDPTRTRR